MKKAIFTAGLALMVTVATAQSNDYIVKTKGAKKTETVAENDSIAQAEEEKVRDFISENFKFYSLCDWQDGMKFMVMPDKYDLIVKTFVDAGTGKEVSSMTLRHKIMIYKGHTQTDEGRCHINFLCQDNNMMYYYEIPSGTFDDYCYGKLGVPTLAYLGDVDIAREKLIGKRMFTKAKVYRVDTEVDGDGYKEVNVKENQEVTVTAVGVGTRSYPVKIIVEDENGNEFYQNVAISKTNSGMRDDEFIMDNAKYLFSGSFELQDAIMAVSKDLESYLGKTVYTKYITEMISKGDGKERTVKVPRMSEFTIESLMPLRNSSYVTLTLKETESRRIYFKDVTFQNVDDVTGDIDGKREDFFGYLFGMGTGIKRETSQAARAAIRQGRVIIGMTEDEVRLAVGEPENIAQGSNGRYDWIYKRSKKLLIVQFDGRTGKVIGYKTSGGTVNSKTPAGSSASGKK